MYDVIIIGCGVVGAATAYQLAKYRLRTLVLEAQNDVANGTTKANSAIIHAGYDPEPGTQMARLNVQGNRMAGEICEKLGVPFARVGSLVLAFCEAERQTLETLFQRGQANGVPGLRLLDGDGARAMEPNLSEAVQAALYAPSAGIVDPWRFALAMAETAVENGASEVDMVINIGWLKNKQYDDVRADIAAVKAAVGDKILKVIIETCLLTDEEKIKMCDIVPEAGADFIKTSTGFSTGGATAHDIALFAAHVKGRCRIKAAGGISTVEDIETFLDLGADRLGTSRAVKLLTTGETGAGY